MKKSSIAATACVAAFVAAAIPVLAQISPGDTGAGVQRGMQDMNYSGQVGSVTLYRSSTRSGTLVVLNVQGQRSGRIESASIQRGKDCLASDIGTSPVWMLNDVSNGRSATVVNASESKLLSGNYVVIVHAGNVTGSMATHGSGGMSANGGNMMLNGSMVSRARWQPVLCGHLYRGS
jgi:hypothetical protein